MKPETSWPAARPPRASPAVTVVIAVYNSAAYLADSIGSVINQSFDDWEAIVVDDFSTDTSYSIAREIARRDDRIHVVRLDRNQGPAVARNTAIRSARGRYIAFLDSDDQWLPEKLERQIDFMRENGYACTCTYYEKVTEAGERTGKIVSPPARLDYAEMLKSNRVGCLSAVYDSAKVGKVYMPLILKRQDYGLWLELLKRVGFVHCLPEVLALYRVRTNSLSTNKFEMLSYNWQLFRRVERLSPWASAYYLGWNVFRKVIE